ncbi:post-transcriptional regulator [Eggerthia catenaformis]|uniref:post-transcriptional regulator n=1 Tax=Eggerthia catenaformis TaxID=31973 RepID=UPI00248EFBA0|nr:post-transcriptional regulator [Eggerthia catenaformis]
MKEKCENMYSINRLPKDINFLIHSKAFEFGNEGIQKIDAQDIKDYLYNVTWKNKSELEYCDIIDDIMSLSFSVVFDYLKTKVIIEAKNKNISDFNDLIFK